MSSTLKKRKVKFSRISCSVKKDTKEDSLKADIHKTIKWSKEDATRRAKSINTNREGEN